MAKVLIVDDDAANRLLVSTLLRHAGHEPIEAASGQEGLRLAHEVRPDLIVVDLYMPGMHGAEFVKELRADQELATTRVALYTGTAVDAMLRDFMQMHRIEHVIPKPCEPEQLLQAITGALA